MRRSILAVALVAAACGGKTRTPNFGSLRAFDARMFHLEHDVQLFSAKNGLRVALIPDARTNLVSVDVRYTVGAAEDPKGRAGLAHLVEHLMFTLREEAGGPTLGDELAEATLTYNAWTTWDETHYTATALAEHLPELLEVEARRLEATCDQLDDAVFLRERDVVLEELAQRTGALDGLRDELLQAVWGKRHPYARGVGSREIADATKQEACDFIAAHYAPDRAILVVSGAIDVDGATARIGKRFGPMARHSTGARVPIDIATLDGGQSEHEADVDEASAMVFFLRPAWGSEREVDHRLVSSLLEAALNQVDRAQAWITDTEVSELGGARASTTVARVSVADPARLDDAVAAIYAAAGSLGGDLAGQVLPLLEGRLRAQYASAYDAFDGRGAWIADYLQYRTDNKLMLDDLADIDAVTLERLTTYAATVFAKDASHVALVRPSGAPSTVTRATVASSGRDYDLAPWRAPVDPAEATRTIAVTSTRVAARVEALSLGNGLRILLAPDPESPVIDARLVFPVGTIADPADRTGVAWLSAALLDHDYGQKLEHEDLERAEWALQLGTLPSTYVDETHTTFGVEGLGVFADWHLWRLAWLLDLGVYTDADLRAVRERVSSDDADEASLRLRTRLFGTGHPYASPNDALGGIADIKAGDLRAFRHDHYSLRGATLIVAGGFDAEQIKQEIGELFAWDAGEPAALATPPAPTPAPGPGYLAVHDDTASLVDLTIGFTARSSQSADRAARLILRVMTDDRVRAVREELGASYGVDVSYVGGAAGTALLISGAVEPTRAAEALARITASLAQLGAGGADLAEDFVRARRHALALVLADSCGASDLAGELQALVEADLPLDGYDELAAQIGATTLTDLAAVAAEDLDPTRMAVMASGPTDAVDAAIAAVAGDAEVETFSTK